MHVVREDDGCRAHSESDKAQNLGCLADADQRLSDGHEAGCHTVTCGPIAAGRGGRGGSGGGRHRIGDGVSLSSSSTLWSCSLCSW